MLAVSVQSQFLNELSRHLCGVLALGIARAAEELAAAAGADDHGFAALVAVDVGRDGTGLPVGAGGVLAEDLGEAAPALDHLAPADRALVLGNLADGGAALFVNGLRVAALAVLARQEKAVLADAIQHPRAALRTRVGRWRASGVLDLLQR